LGKVQHRTDGAFDDQKDALGAFALAKEHSASGKSEGAAFFSYALNEMLIRRGQNGYARSARSSVL
jgi:hypothetical protein